MSATAAPQPQQPGQDPLQQQSSQTLASIAEGIKKANPGIDMLDLFDATEATIGQMKGVSDALKNQMVYDTNTAKLVFGMQELMAKIQSNDRNVDVKALAQQITAQTRADAAEDVAGTNAGARVEAAKIGGKSRTDAARHHGPGAHRRRVSSVRTAAATSPTQTAPAATSARGSVRTAAAMSLRPTRTLATMPPTAATTAASTAPA
jgi:hypothetical protein